MWKARQSVALLSKRDGEEDEKKGRGWRVGAMDALCANEEERAREMSRRKKEVASRAEDGRRMCLYVCMFEFTRRRVGRVLFGRQVV